MNEGMTRDMRYNEGRGVEVKMHKEIIRDNQK